MSKRQESSRSPGQNDQLCKGPWGSAPSKGQIRGSSHETDQETGRCGEKWRKQKHAQSMEQETRAAQEARFQSVCGPDGSTNCSAPFILLLSLFNPVLKGCSKFCLFSVLVNSGALPKHLLLNDFYVQEFITHALGSWDSRPMCQQNWSLSSQM